MMPNNDTIKVHGFVYEITDLGNEIELVIRANSELARKLKLGFIDLEQKI